VEVPGVPPGKVHDQLVGELVLLSVKLMHPLGQMLVELAVNDATGGPSAGAPLMLMLSTYSICPYLPRLRKAIMKVGEET
jgi:hypothetical protein